ncbi:TonB-dependent receptor [Neorhizobium sp. NCHU2750]|uniref:TonB-dependent receptor n=1 Tax=Neorhizobium sp. NCHU2750 TaxID=1825976 RepID=UPI000E76C801|nr:iron complex outermembrane recepter protein [Neorhizobium sp. NCHU2750]
MRGKTFTCRTVVLLAATAMTAIVGDAIAIRPALAQATGERLRNFDIPVKPIRQGMNDIVRATGINVVFPETPAASSPGKAVHGSMSTAKAIESLLLGSGLQFSFTNSNTVTITTASQEAERGASDATTLAPIVLKADANSTMTPMPAYAGGQVATGGQIGLLGNRNVMDTPFNITSYTGDLIKDQQALSVSDVLANNAAARIFYPDNDGSTDFLLRGNKVSQLDIAYDGLYGIGTPGIESIERVDLLVGANALLNGLGPIGGVGGMINQVPKRALDTPLTEVTTGYYGGQFGGGIDVSRRYGADGEFGIRFNGAYRDGDTGVDHQSRKVGTATAALDWHDPDNDARVSVNLGYRANENDAPNRTTYLLSSTFRIPGPPSDPTSNWQNPWSYDNTYTKFGTARVEYDITPDVTAYAAVGGSRFTEEQLFANTFLMDNSGTLGQRQVYWPLYRNSVTAEAGLRGEFETGPVTHRWSLAASGMSINNGIALNTLATTYSNLYDPVFITEPSIAGLADAENVPRTASTRLSGVALADTLSVLDDRIQFTLGIRDQDVNAKNYDPATGDVTSIYDKNAWTPAYALVVKPWEKLSLYANYIEGLQQGGMIPAGYADAGHSLAPFITKQYEIGAKYDFGDFLVSLGGYQVTTPNAIASGLSYGVDGEQRTRGLEFNAQGEIASGVRLLGGIALINARQTRTAGGTNDGKKVNGAADIQVNVGAEWDPAFLPGWTVSGRAIYTGSAYIDAGNQQSIPDWTRLDAGLRYQTKLAGHETSFRFNVENIANKSYWIAGNGFVMNARPRTFVLSASMKF